MSDKLKVDDVVRVVEWKRGRPIFHEYDMTIIEVVTESGVTLVNCSYIDDKGNEIIEKWHPSQVYITRGTKIDNLLNLM